MALPTNLKIVDNTVKWGPLKVAELRTQDREGVRSGALHVPSIHQGHSFLGEVVLELVRRIVAHAIRDGLHLDLRVTDLIKGADLRKLLPHVEIKLHDGRLTAKPRTRDVGGAPFSERVCAVARLVAESAGVQVRADTDGIEFKLTADIDIDALVDAVQAEQTAERAELTAELAAESVPTE